MRDPLRRWAVLFDLDGTLLDTVGLILASVRHAFAEHPGPRPTDADWIAGIGQPLRVQLRPYAADAEALERLVERYRVHFRANHDAGTRCFPGALDAVRLLHERGHPVGAVTSKMTELAGRALRHVGLAPWIDVVVGADSCARHKPDPEPVWLALERLGRGPAEAVLVGDSPHDIAAAAAAGVATIAVTWGACSREALAAAGPTRMVDSIADLLAEIERLERQGRR